MKYYLIDQLFIDMFYIKLHLVVSKQIANNEEDANKQYLEEVHPNDTKRQEFIKRYLTVDEVCEQQFNSVNQDDIYNNRKKIGIWL